MSDQPRRRTTWLLLLVLAAAATWMGWDWLGAPSRPERVYQRLTQAGERGDYRAVWDGFDTESKARLAVDGRRHTAELTDPAEAERLAGLPDEELFVELCRRGRLPAAFDWDTVTSWKVSGSRAVLHVQRRDGVSGEVVMVKEGGLWKVSAGPSSPPARSDPPPQNQPGQH